MNIYSQTQNIYYMPVTILSIIKYLWSQSLQQSFEVSIVIPHILQTRKLRQGETLQLTRSHRQ